ncbi:MAG: hypothetical protein ACJASO_001869 [Cyclobacteriaceae bacterium]|jgi:hypothetical protein
MLDAFSQKIETRTQIDDSLFNSGNVHSALQLVQSLSPGILIAKAGSDPNESLDVLARGVTTLTGSNTPLVVVDGVSGISIESIDPNDIASIQFLTGAEAVKYGLLGGAGVMEILTKSGASRSLGVRFNSFTALEQKIYQSPVMNRSQFLAAGGNDLGEDRDWMDHITQDAFSYVNQISIDQKLDCFSYLISLNNRQMNGILQETDRKRTNLFGKLGWSSIDKKLSLMYMTSLVDERSAPGFNETFKMALLANTTMPETFPSGDLYDPNQFNISNPQGFIETSRRATNTSALHHLSATYDFGFLAISGRYASFNQNQVFLDQYIQGLQYFANKIQYKYEAERVRSNVSLDLHKKILTKGGSLDLSVGAKLNSWQTDRSSDNEVIYIQSRNDTIISSSQSDDINILNVYLGWSFVPTSDIFQMSGRYHVVSSDSHGSDVGASLLYSHHFSISPFARLIDGIAINFRINQGVTGLTPLDTELKNQQIWPDGIISQEANSNFTFEKQSHFDIGAEVFTLGEKVQLSVFYYIKQSGQLLALNESIGVSRFYFPLDMLVTNEGLLINRGWEFMATYRQSLGEKKWLSSRLSLTTMDTEWTDMPYSGTTDQFLGIIGDGSAQPCLSGS